MIPRRTSREWAVQLLFQEDLNRADNLDAALKIFWKDKDSDESSRAFAEEIVRGVLAKRKEIDEAISDLAEHWNIRRIGIVELNVLRMAIYEMLHHLDVPPVVIINEAVDITKFFGTRDSGRFVNGILDRFCKRLERPRRTAEKG